MDEVLVCHVSRKRLAQGVPDLGNDVGGNRLQLSVL
uniref:Uncharacterized protein n=1 Tax=Mycolicibacterium sp. CBMA 213 TaxID=1968788 RepID=A0A343VRR6_9MYCO|nr:hypothetical protein B5P44_p00295 [Mycolicibacterium sp. CBMA 213]